MTTKLAFNYDLLWHNLRKIIGRETDSRIKENNNTSFEFRWVAKDEEDLSFFHGILGTLSFILSQFDIDVTKTVCAIGFWGDFHNNSTNAPFHALCIKIKTKKKSTT